MIARNAIAALLLSAAVSGATSPAAPPPQAGEGQAVPAARHTVLNFVPYFENRLVKDLPPESVEIWERVRINKKRRWQKQPVAKVYTAKGRSHRTVLLVDISDSVSSVGKIPYALGAIRQFLLNFVTPADKVLLVFFASTETFGNDKGEGCSQAIQRGRRLLFANPSSFREPCTGLWTNDIGRFQAELAHVDARGATDLFGAIRVGTATFHLLDEPTGDVPPTKGMILFTDGQDTIATTSRARIEAENSVRNSGAVVYVVYTGVSEGLRARAAQGVLGDGEEVGGFLNRITEKETGGRFYRQPMSKKNLQDALAQIEIELRNTFTAVYYPRSGKPRLGEEREIRIVINADGKTNPNDPESDKGYRVLAPRWIVGN